MNRKQPVKGLKNLVRKIIKNAIAGNPECIDIVNQAIEPQIKKIKNNG